MTELWLSLTRRWAQRLCRVVSGLRRNQRSDFGLRMASLGWTSKTCGRRSKLLGCATSKRSPMCPGPEREVSMTHQPAFGDLAHLGHIELLTPRFEKSLAFFKDVMGLHESGRQGDSVYLRAWADYERFTLQLTRSATSGVGHVAFRARSADVLQRLIG